MGYRLCFHDTKKTCFVCNKFFGYIDDDVMKNLKSWEWIRKREAENDERYRDVEQALFWWHFVTEAHQFELTHDEVEEFLTLYVNDRVSQGIPDSLDEYSEILKLPKAIIEWG